MAGQARTTFDVEWRSKEWRDSIKREAARIGPVADKQLEITAIDIVNRAKQLAAVDTGFMRNSIKWGKIDGGYEVYCAANYAFFIEYGTRYMSAQPFMRPAFAEGIQRLIARLA